MKKGNTSFLSSNPLAYAVELTAESPLFTGIGYSWISYILKPLADCVKSAPLFNILQSVTGNTESSFPYKKTAHSDGIGNARAVRQQRPFLKPEQTGKLSISLAHYRRGAYCEGTKQYAKTLAHTFRRWGSSTLSALLWARPEAHYRTRPHSFPCGCRWNRLRSTAQAVSYTTRSSLSSVGTIKQNLTNRKERNAFSFSS